MINTPKSAEHANQSLELKSSNLVGELPSLPLTDLGSPSKTRTIGCSICRVYGEDMTTISYGKASSSAEAIDGLSKAIEYALSKTPEVIVNLGKLRWPSGDAGDAALLQLAEVAHCRRENGRYLHLVTTNSDTIDRLENHALNKEVCVHPDINSAVSAVSARLQLDRAHS